MIKININGIDWNIEFEDESDPDLGTEYIGRTVQWKQRIVVNKTVTPQIMREVLIHELTHATLASQGRYFQQQFTTEDVCEFVGFNADNIIEKADYIMGMFKKHEREGADRDE